MVLRTIETRHDGIIGQLTDAEGQIVATTLEHAYLQPDGSYAPLIPRGQTYTCIRYRSPKFGYDVFVINGVPGHDFIELHRANYQSQLDGCVALGDATCESAQGCMLTNSKVTFERFMADMAGIDTFSLTVLDAGA